MVPAMVVVLSLWNCLMGSTAASLLSLQPVFPQVRKACRVRLTPTAATVTEVQPSFVQTEMRGAAMKLHTRDQSREGEQQAQTPVSKWEPGRADYLQFLVDSQLVYGCFEDLVSEMDVLAPFRNSGLERHSALELDIAWFKDQGVPTPAASAQGEKYVALLRDMAAKGQWPAFVCHFYNHYFAHTAGGRRIGRMMADKLLDGRTLHFYQWSAGDVDSELLPSLRCKIDTMAASWTREEKDACLRETQDCFKYSGGLLDHIRRPPV